MHPFDAGTMEFESYADLVEKYVARSREIEMLGLSPEDYKKKMAQLKQRFSEYAKTVETLL